MNKLLLYLVITVLTVVIFSVDTTIHNTISLWIMDRPFVYPFVPFPFLPIYFFALVLIYFLNTPQRPFGHILLLTLGLALPFWILTFSSVLAIIAFLVEYLIIGIILELIFKLRFFKPK